MNWKSILTGAVGTVAGMALWAYVGPIITKKAGV